MKRLLYTLMFTILIPALGFAASVLVYPKFQAFDSNGDPLSGGKVFTYQTGSGTSKTTYSNYGGTVANTNPVILNSRGEANIYLNGAYKLVLKDSKDSLIWTIDNVFGEGGDVLSSTSGYIAIISGTTNVTGVSAITGASITPGTIPSTALPNPITSGVSTDQLTTGGVYAVNLTSSENLSGRTIYGGALSNYGATTEVTGTAVPVLTGMNFSFENAGTTSFVIEFNSSDSVIGIVNFSSGNSVIVLHGLSGSAYGYVRYLDTNKWIISGASIATRNK